NFTLESEHTLAQSMRLAGLRGGVFRSIELISAIGVAGTMLYGGFHILHGRMLPGELVVFTSYLNSMYAPIRVLADISSQLSLAAVARERIIDLFAVVPEVREKPGATKVKVVRGEIEFRNVWFGYNAHHPALQDVSFRIAGGEKLALVGPSGAGKSTIASL